MKTATPPPASRRNAATTNGQTIHRASAPRGAWVGSNGSIAGWSCGSAASASGGDSSRPGGASARGRLGLLLGGGGVEVADRAGLQRRGARRRSRRRRFARGRRLADDENVPASGQIAAHRLAAQGVLDVVGRLAPGTDGGDQ